MLDADADRVRPAARRADDQRHEALSELGSVRVARGARSCPTLWHRRDADDSRLERRVFVRRRAVFTRRAVPSIRGERTECSPRLGASTCSGRTSTAGRLAAAARGQFDEADFADTPDGSASAVLHDERRRSRVSPAMRSMVRFESRDLLSDAAPRGHARPDRVPQRADLLRSRNAGAIVRRRSIDALAPGGFLVLGKVETMLGPARSRVRAGRRARANLSAAMSGEHRRNPRAASPTTPWRPTARSRRSASARASRSSCTTPWRASAGSRTCCCRANRCRATDRTRRSSRRRRCRLAARARCDGSARDSSA